MEEFPTRWPLPAGFLFMNTYEINDGEWLISTDQTLLDRAFVHGFLQERSYWAKSIPAEIVDRSIEHSLCFGVYRSRKQVAFCRVISDYATFAWLADVFVDETQRGLGLGKRLVTAVRAHPQLHGLRRFMLCTADAHKLYAQFGFAPIKRVELFMEILDPNPYRCAVTVEQDKQ
jgi:N-acetylglutamate synthase-like GNAT family acetyltransferase